MICIISGLDTTNLYKNQPIHPEVIALAKQFMAEEPKASMSDALKFIAYTLVNDIKYKLQEGETPHE